MWHMMQSIRNWMEIMVRCRVRENCKTLIIFRENRKKKITKKFTEQQNSQCSLENEESLLVLLKNIYTRLFEFKIWILNNH